MKEKKTKKRIELDMTRPALEDEMSGFPTMERDEPSTSKVPRRSRWKDNHLKGIALVSRKLENWQFH